MQACSIQSSRRSDPLQADYDTHHCLTHPLKILLPASSCYSQHRQPNCYLVSGLARYRCDPNLLTLLDETWSVRESARRRATVALACARPLGRRGVHVSVRSTNFQTCNPQLRHQNKEFNAHSSCTNFMILRGLNLQQRHQVF